MDSKIIALPRRLWFVKKIFVPLKVYIIFVAMPMPNITVVIPTRGDRPLLLENCLRMVKSQTLKPRTIIIVDDPPMSSAPDITWRYKMGYREACRDSELPELVAFMEDDDWYSPNYLEWFYQQWLSLGCPDLFGSDYTYYYHVKLCRYFRFDHAQRASMMNTFLRPGLIFPWPADSDPYTDAHLWGLPELKKMVVSPPVLSVGIKHGAGLTGGHFHNSRLHRYNVMDPGMDWLRSIVDPASFQLYKMLAASLPEIPVEKTTYQWNRKEM